MLQEYKSALFDSMLSTESENAPQNKVVSASFNSINNSIGSTNISDIGPSLTAAIRNTKDELDRKYGTIYKVRGSKANYTDLPTTGNMNGDVWNIENPYSDPTIHIAAGDNVVWIEDNPTTGAGHWDKLSGDIDLSDYYTKTEIDDHLVSGIHSFKFGVDSDGNYGYVKNIGGADTVIPFKTVGELASPIKSNVNNLVAADLPASSFADGKTHNGIGKLSVQVPCGTETKTITADGTYTPTGTDSFGNRNIGFSSVTVLINHTDIKNSDQSGSDTSAKTYSVDLGANHKIRYVNVKTPNTNDGTYNATANGTFDMGVNNHIRYVKVAFSNSTTYTPTVNSSASDMGQYNNYRYVNTTTVYNLGYNSGRTQGRNDVINSPNTYGLYTAAQRTAAYNSGYSAGDTAGYKRGWNEARAYAINNFKNALKTNYPPGSTDYMNFDPTLNTQVLAGINSYYPRYNRPFSDGSNVYVGNCMVAWINNELYVSVGNKIPEDSTSFSWNYDIKLTAAK